MDAGQWVSVPIASDSKGFARVELVESRGKDSSLLLKSRP